MSMSVGLGKIQNDPDATPLTRKALGALSTPHLIVDNQGISVDDEGRLFVRLVDGGGVIMADGGLTTETVYGIDSEINLEETKLYDRDWNMRLTGTAPNYIASSLYIGADDLLAELAELTAIGSRVDDAKVQIYSQHTQLRTFYDKTSWMSVKTYPGGGTEFYSCGPSESNCGFNFITTSGNSIIGDHVTGNDAGIRINNGEEITQILSVKVLINFAGGGAVGNISWAEYTTSFSPTTARDDRDTVYVSRMDGIAIPSEHISYIAMLDFLGRLVLRITWIGVTAAENVYYKFVIVKFKNQ